MTIPSAVASFAVVAGLVTIIPGLDTALVLRSALTQSRRHAFATALGISSGVLVWGAAAAVGVSALLTASQAAFDVLRAAGAGYMIWLGGGMLWRSRPRHGLGAEAGPGGRRAAVPFAAGGLRSSWSRGVATNLLNPKIGVFYVAMLPPFIPQHASHLLMGLLLALVHDLEGLAWFTLLITGVRGAHRWLRGSAAHRAIDRATGAVLLGFGLKLALSRR